MKNTKGLEKDKDDEAPAGELAETYAVTDQEQFEELLPALLNSSQSVFYIAQDKKFQVVTKQLLKQMVLSQKELLGREPLSIVHPDDRAMVRENAVKMLKGKRSKPYEFRALDKAGNIHYIMEAVTSITYQGKPATLGNWIELTEQKRAEEELRRSENSLIEAQRIAHLGNWDWEIKPDILHWSAEMYRIFGFKPQQFAANYGTFLDSVHPDDREFVQQSVYAALYRNQPYNIEYRIVLPDNSKRIIYASGKVSFDDKTGEPIRMLGTVQDITERKQAEEELWQNERKYRTLVENLPQKIFLKDKNLVYISCNENYARDLEIKTEAVAGKTDYDFFPKKLAEKYRADDRKIMELKKPEDIEEGYIIDGQEAFVHTTKTPIIGENGEAAGVLGIFWDITERKRAEDALRKSEEFSSSLMKSSAVPILVVNDDTSIEYVNPAFEKLTGFTAKEVIGQTAPYTWWLKEAASGDVNEIKRDIHTGVRQLEKLFRKKNGDRFWVEITSAPVKRNEEFKYSLENWLDITEQKARQQQLIESESKYRSIFESANDVIVLMDHRGRILDVNSKIIEVAGHNREDLIGRDFRTLAKIITKKSLAKLTYNFAKRIAGINVPPYEVEMRNKNGEIINVEINAVPLKINGKIAGDLAILRDITQQKRSLQAIEESEEKFSKAFQSNPNSCFITSLKGGKFIEINDSFSRITGFTKKDAIGNTAGKINLWAGEKDGEKIRLILRKHGRVTAEEITFRTKKGEIRHGMYSAEIVKLSGEDCVLTTINDVTERKMMVDELRKHKDHLEELVQQRTKELASLNKQLKKELAERKRIEEELLTAINNTDAANRAKGDFLARMSHEIRTPIHGVMGTLDLLRDTELGQEQRQYVSMAKTSAESLLNVINDILDFSKIEAGKIELDTRDFDLRTLLEQTLETIAVPAHKKGLEIMLQISRDVPEALVGDAGRLRQVLVNLLGNAAKFTEQGEIVLRVNAEADGEKEAELHFSVRDTGIGIPEEKQKQLFHPFEQVDGSMNRKYGGSGLGLSICLQLVNIMGGRIWFTSWPGEGSIFHFTAKFGKQTGEKEAKRIMEIPDSLRGIPILLIDDNATCRAILRDALNARGFQVTEVDNVRSAQQELEDGKGTSRYFRMIMLDKTMPGMNGFAMAEQILRDPALRSSIVMMLTSNSISDDFARCQELGISHYLVKPIKESELLKTILTALGYAKTEDETSQQAVPMPSGNDAPHLNILVAEDNATSQVIAKKTLEKAGHAVQIAGNGVEAIRMVKEGNHDLVLMDVEMPEMNGLEATQFIRKTEQKSGQHIPIIAMTAYAMKEDRQRCLQAGMDAYLSKPVNLEELYSIISDFSLGKDSKSEVMDIEAALKLVGDDEDILKEVVTVFLEQDYPEQLKRLRDGIDRNNAQTVKEAAHSVKGAVRSFGGTALSGTALRLEEMGRNNDLTGAEAALQELEEEAKQFTDFFARYSQQKA